MKTNASGASHVQVRQPEQARRELGFAQGVRIRVARDGQHPVEEGIGPGGCPGGETAKIGFPIRRHERRLLVRSAQLLVEIGVLRRADRRKDLENAFQPEDQGILKKPNVVAVVVRAPGDEHEFECVARHNQRL